MTIANTVDTKAVNRRITNFSKAGQKWQANAHAIAMDCIRLSLPGSEGGHLDANTAARFLNAFPKGTRVKAAAAWFRAFSNIVPKVGKDGVWSCKMTGPKLKAYKVVDLAAADASPFWTPAEADVDPRVFKLGETLARLLKRCEDAAAKGELSAEDREVVEALKANAKVRQVLPKVKA